MRTLFLENGSKNTAIKTALSESRFCELFLPLKCIPLQISLVFALQMSSLNHEIAAINNIWG